MGWKVTSAPAVEPILTAAMKTYLKVDTTADDDLIGELITAAREYVEAYLGQALITQTIQEKWDTVPPVINGKEPTLELTVHPVQSVTSITYVDTDGNTQTLDSGNYDVDTHRDVARIRIGYGESWPSLRSEINALTVTYVAGYGATAATVPAYLVQAIRLIVADMYDNRTDYVKGLPTAAERLMDRAKHGIGIGI